MKEHSVFYKIYKEFQADIEKVRGRSVGYKLEYFFMYYKIPLLLTAAAAAIIISVFYSHSQYKEPAFSALFINAENTLSDEAFSREFGKQIEFDADHDTISIDSSLWIDGNSQGSIASTEKLAANVNSQLLDICVMPEELFFIYAEQGVFGNLQNFLTKEQFTEYTDQIVYLDDVPVGIKAEGLRRIAQGGLYSAENVPIFGIIYNTKHVEECRLFLDFLAK